MGGNVAVRTHHLRRRLTGRAAPESLRSIGEKISPDSNIDIDYYVLAVIFTHTLQASVRQDEIFNKSNAVVINVISSKFKYRP